MALRSNSRPIRQLPANPSVENLKKQAKALLRAHKHGDASACQTLRRLPRLEDSDDAGILSAKVGLREAQQALAMDYGCEDWIELMVRAEGNEGIVRAIVRATNQLADVDSVLDKYVSPDYVFHGGGPDVPLSEARAYLKRGRALALGLGRMKVKVSLDEISSSGDHVRYTVRPSGLPFGDAEGHRMVLETRFVEGKIVETWQREGFFPSIPDVDTPEGQLKVADSLHELGFKRKALQWARESVAHGLPQAALSTLGLRPSRKDVHEFFSKCLDGLNESKPLLRVLHEMLREARRSIRTRAIARAIERVGEAVEAGESFSEALASQPTVFDKASIVMVQEGETAARMEDQLAMIVKRPMSSESYERESDDPEHDDVLVRAKATFANIEKALNSRSIQDLAGITDRCWADSFVAHLVDIVRTGNSSQAMSWLASCIDALPDLSVSITDVTRKGSIVGASWEVSGTLTLPGVGHEKRTTTKGVCRGRLAGGKVIEGWVHGSAPLAPTQDLGPDLFNIGRMLQHGYWLREDPNAAKEWYAQAAEQGYPPPPTDREVQKDSSLGNEAAPVIRLVNLVLAQAIGDGATELLFSSLSGGGLGMRYDVDGNFWDMKPAPSRIAPYVLNRVKIMAGLQPYERGYPLHGAISMRIADANVDAQVTVDRTEPGERIHLMLQRSTL